MDEDYIRKNAGRGAGNVVRGARFVSTHLFAKQDEWIYKKVASKISGTERDPDSTWQHGRFRGGGGRGRGGGRRGDRRKGGGKKDEPAAIDVDAAEE